VVAEETGSWKGIKLPFENDKRKIGLFDVNLTSNPSTLQVVWFPSGEWRLGIPFVVVISNESVEKWCGKEISKYQLLGMFIRVFTNGENIQGAPFLLAFANVKCHMLTLVMRTRTNEFQISLHSEFLRLQLMVRKMEEEMKNNHEVMKEKNTVISNLETEVKIKDEKIKKLEKEVKNREKRLIRCDKC